MDLKEYLYQKRMTINHLSEQIGYNRAYLSRIINGKLIPSMRLAKEIEKFTDGNVTVEELIKETTPGT